MKKKEAIWKLLQNDLDNIRLKVNEGYRIISPLSIETHFDQAMHNHFKILEDGLSALEEKTAIVTTILEDYSQEQARLDDLSA